MIQIKFRKGCGALLCLLFSFLCSISNAQKTYYDTISFKHNGRKANYGKQMYPKDGYYVSDVKFSVDGQRGCEWCYPKHKKEGGSQIINYGESVLFHTSCDGLPCEFFYIIKYKKYFIDTSIIKISMDTEEDLSSTIYAKNESSETIELVYRVETYNSNTLGYITTTSSIKIPGFRKIRVMPRYKRVDNTLREDFLTALYTR